MGRYGMLEYVANFSRLIFLEKRRAWLIGVIFESSQIVFDKKEVNLIRFILVVYPIDAELVNFHEDYKACLIETKHRPSAYFP